MFPGDEELVEKIQQIKSQTQSKYNNNNNSMTERSEIDPNSSAKKTQKQNQPKDTVLTEKEIQKKVEDYKQRLNVDLTKLINEEKDKESLRMKQHENSNPEEKKKLETDMTSERNASSQKIMNLTK